MLPQRFIAAPMHQLCCSCEYENEKVPTYELCWFVWSFVDERLESLLHGVDKLLVLHEADVDDVINLVFKVQQLLHHRFVFFWIDYDCAPKSLQVDFPDNRKTVTDSGCKMTHRAPSSPDCQAFMTEQSVPSHLYILYPVLQKDLDAAPHSTEELVEKSQILNPVLIQQMSQAWKVPTTGRRSELSATVIYYQYIDNVPRVQLSLLLVCTFLQSGCEMFTQQLFLHSGNEGFSRGREAMVTNQSLSMSQRRHIDR